MSKRYAFAAFLVASCMPLAASAAIYTVDTLNDAGPGSLRQALIDAQATPDDDMIVFDPTLSAGSTIVLTNTLVISTAVAIGGRLRIEGDGRIEVSGNDAVRVFLIDNGADVEIDQLTIRMATPCPSMVAAWRSPASEPRLHSATACWPTIEPVWAADLQTPQRQACWHRA